MGSVRWRAVSARAGIAGVTALCAAAATATIAVEYGWRMGWAERFYNRWLMQSLPMVERGYEQQSAGNTRSAVGWFRRALEGDPGSPYRWCDYGEALLAGGDEDGARRCLLRALELGPALAPVLMRAVNFGYRTGDAELALERGIELLDVTAAYDERIFGTWQGMEIPTSAVLRRGLPDARSAEAYLDFLTAREQPDIGQVWQWMLDRRYATEKAAGKYVGALMRTHKYGAAARVWAAFAGAPAGYPDADAIFNGSFEREPSAVELDWQIARVAGAEVDRQEGGAADRQWCLRMSFDGTENLVFGHVWQKAVVRAGEYILSAKLKTDRVTTDQGIVLRVSDADAPSRLNVQTPGITGSHDWTTVEVPIAVPVNTRLLDIRVVRSASLKFDNKLAGTAWLDAVHLHRSRPSLPPDP